MATSTEIKQRANALADKTDVNSITPKEVGGIMYDLASHSENVLRNGGTLGIRKVYESVSAMEADGINPVDLWGNPIKKGNLVVIYDGTTTGVDNNKVYTFMNPGWQFATYFDAGYATRSELSELGQVVGLNGTLNKSGVVKIVENKPKGTIKYNYNLSANKTYKISIIPNSGDVYTYIVLHKIDGTSSSILNQGTISLIPDKDVVCFDVMYGAEMTALSVEINIETTIDVINYAPLYSQFDEVFKKFGHIESVEFLSANTVRLRESRGAWVFGFKLDINDTPFKVGDSLCLGLKNVISNNLGSFNFACYDENESIISALKSVNLTTSDLMLNTLDVVQGTKYIVGFIQGKASMDVTLGDCILIEGNTILGNYRYSRNAIADTPIVQVNYAPFYPNFNKALLPNDLNVSIKSNNEAVLTNESGAKVFGFQTRLGDTPFKVGDYVYVAVKDVVLNTGSGYLMLIFYDKDEQRIGSVYSANLATSNIVEIYKEIPTNTEYIVIRFQSAGELNASVGEMILAKHNIKGNTQYIRTPLVLVGGSDTNNKTIYVNGDYGDDNSRGSKGSPVKTLSEALRRSGSDANIVLLGNVYDSLNIKENDNQQSIRIVGEQGKVNRIILGNKITTATLVQEGVYQYNIDSFPSESTSYCLWQHDIADSSTAIKESDKHPLQRGKTHRLDSTKLSRVSSIDAVKSSSKPVFFYDYSNKVLYFRVVSGSVLANNPIYMPTPNAAIYGNDGSVKVEMVNIESWYSNFDLSNCNGGLLTECAAKFGVNGGFSWKDCNGLQFIRCEACGIHDYDNNYGDGFSVGSTISEPTTAKCATAVMYDCWSHDNHDDGYSDHLNNETTIDGGLFEYNDGGVTTSYGSKDIVKNVYARNNTEAGITVYGGSAEGTESFVSNCICENNSPYNFSVVNGGSRKTKGTFVNCISINAENTGYYASGSNVEMTVINCYDNGSPNAKSANVSSKKSNIV